MTENPVRALVYAKRRELSEALAATGLPFEKFAAACAADLAAVPKLRDAVMQAPETFLQCINVAGVCGLIPGKAHDQFFLIPRYDGKTKRTVCTFIVGYKGLCKMAMRSEEVAYVDARLVFEGEEFEADQATGFIKHPIDFGIEQTEDKIVGGYGIARFKNEPAPLLWPLSRKELMAIKHRSSAYHKEKDKDHPTGPWFSDWKPMHRKGPLRSMCNSGSVPLTTEAHFALQAETAEEIKVAAFDVQPAPSRVAELTEGLKREELLEQIGALDADDLQWKAGEVAGHGQPTDVTTLTDEQLQTLLTSLKGK